MPTAPPTETQPSVEAHVFWLRYHKQIAVALVIIVLGMIGFAGYRFFQNRRNDSAAEALGGAKSQHDYEQVIEQYSGTAAGASAYLLLAQKQREEKKFTEANGTLQKFVEKYPAHDLVPTAQLAIATNLESLGKEDEALAIYQQVAAKYANTYCGPLAMISQVPILKAKNRSADARRVCEEMLTKYRMPGQQAAEGVRDDRMETVWVGEAMRQMRSMKLPELAKPATPAANAAAPAMIAAPSTAPAAPPPPAGAPTPKKP